VRDAQGNALATYALKKDSLYLIEQNLYGSSRLGVKNLAILAQIDMQKLELSDTFRIFEDFVGAKNYELSNHLGNVLATISDKTIFNTDHYNGLVYSAQLYYPFGWEIPTLSYTAKKYRFGFNGKEDDREWHAQDYGFRLYTPRESRFISVDPITAQYPELTPYQFASNTPIQAVDLDGLEGSPSTIAQKQELTALIMSKAPQTDELTILNTIGLKSTFGAARITEYFHSPRNEGKAKARGFTAQAYGIDFLARHLDGMNNRGRNVKRTAYIEHTIGREKLDLVIYFTPDANVQSGSFWADVENFNPDPIGNQIQKNFYNIGFTQTRQPLSGVVYFVDFKSTTNIDNTISGIIDAVAAFERMSNNFASSGTLSLKGKHHIPRYMIALDAASWEQLFVKNEGQYALQTNVSLRTSLARLAIMGGGIFPIENLNDRGDDLLKEIVPHK
jgi:RHS repeat-associated protein